MITTHKDNLIQRCKQRGYSIEDVLPCVVKQNGDIWTIDETHQAYPHEKNTESKPITELDIGEGVGSELKNMLKFIGITSSPTCGCNAKAKYMNEKGIDWCKQNIDLIVSWLKEEAEKRKLPFFSYGAKKLVKLAIYRAEKQIK